MPERYAGRTFHIHNPQVTLMRTTPEENDRFAAWIAERLNRMTGPVRFLIPEGGVSALDAPGQPFHDPEALAALSRRLRADVTETDTRRLVSVPHNLNTPEFAEAALAALEEIL